MTDKFNLREFNQSASWYRPIINSVKFLSKKKHNMHNVCLVNIFFPTSFFDFSFFCMLSI